MNLFLIDGIGPFFRACHRRRINWSKIPFDQLEVDGQPDPKRFQHIRDDFERFTDRAAGMGFNAVVLDDLAHLCPRATYGDGLNRKIEAYRREYARLFEIAVDRGMQVFVTTDVMFFPASHEARIDREADVFSPLAAMCAGLFASFPCVGGVIFRVGECDGVDVRGDFKSRLVIKTPRQARLLIERLLPAFETYQRLLVFRTWTVGAHPIGDLIWNRNTFDKTFAGIDSPRFVLSMKYGESDFFRYLPLNKLFFRSRHPKIIELQGRREYEGAGEYPSFVGWDYEQYIRRLDGAVNVIGAWIWAQTGGWSVFRRLTFLEPEAIWNDINVFVSVKIARDRMSTEQAVEAFCRWHLGGAEWTKLLVLLRFSDEVVKELLYIDQIAHRKLFFRRVRVPTLLSVFWDTILVNHSMRKLVSCLVDDPEEPVVQGYAALQKIRAMQRLAEQLELPSDDIARQYDTFEILAAARAYYLAPFDHQTVDRLQRMKQRYQERYRIRYAVKLDFEPFRFPRRRLRHMLGLFLRHKRGYRLVDRILMLGVLSMISPLLVLARQKTQRDLLHGRAMGIRTVLK